MKKIYLLTIFLFLTVSAYTQSNRPMVYDISISAGENSTIISWKLPAKNVLSKISKILIYKSNSPFTASSRLDTVSPLIELPPAPTRYSDVSAGFQTSYYAVIACYKDGTPYSIIIPTVNATVYSISLTSPDYSAGDKSGGAEKQESVEPFDDGYLLGTIPTEGAIRDTPLPYLKLFKDEDSPVPEKGSTPLTSGKTKAVPFIFETDRNDNCTGDAYVLYSIIKDCFMKSSWFTTERELKQFLTVNHSEMITARAQIYLGQALYFQKKHKEALGYFLSAEDYYSAVSKKWIQIVLDDFELPDESEHS